MKFQPFSLFFHTFYQPFSWKSEDSPCFFDSLCQKFRKKASKRCVVQCSAPKDAAKQIPTENAAVLSVNPYKQIQRCPQSSSRGPSADTAAWLWRISFRAVLIRSYQNPRTAPCQMEQASRISSRLTYALIFTGTAAQAQTPSSAAAHVPYRPGCRCCLRYPPLPFPAPGGPHAALFRGW